jgi:hypothetical protein
MFRKVIIVDYEKHLKIFVTNIELFIFEPSGRYMCLRQVQQSIKTNFSLLIDAID